MTVGDIVNIDLTALTTYVPAAGVEILILKSFTNDQNMSYGFTNGVALATAYYVVGSYPVYYDSSATGTKFGITNTQYYTNNSTSGNKGFSGIQIK